MTQTAIVLGGAPCFREDMAALDRLRLPVIAVNDQIASWPGEIIAGATLHTEKAAGWRAARSQSAPWDFWGQIETPAINRAVRWRRAWHGTSSLYAVQIALYSMGVHRVILAGVPIDARPNAFHGGVFKSVEHYREGWGKALPKIRGRVASMSGWTREILGGPEQWCDDVLC